MAKFSYFSEALENILDISKDISVPEKIERTAFTMWTESANSLLTTARC